MDVISPAHNIIDDDLCDSILVKLNTTLLGQFLPHIVNVVDEINEGCGPICWFKRHNSVGPLDHVNPLKSKFFLTRLCHSQLMVPHRRIEHPHPCPSAKHVEDCGITSRDGVCNLKSYAIERDVVHAETPDEVLNVVDVFLMGFCSEECLEQPQSICDLNYVTNLG
jgi:hypothetical protein